MAHFSTTFHVKPDLNRGEIRLSIQVSEARVDEWWVSAPDVREVLAMEGAEGWRGEGSLKIRFNQGTADVAVYDKQGHRTVIRAFPSAVKLLLAQLRAAVADVPERAIEERIIIKNASPDEGVIREAVRLAIQDEIGMMRIGVIDALKIELRRIEQLIGQIEISPVVEVTGAASVVEATPDDTPVFIPSGVGKGAQEGSVKTTSKKSAGVDGALKALKAKKGKKK
jgi:hypothetical protein